jgi:hypothetical protein
MKTTEISEDYAIVLQQLDESGEEDFEYLVETLRYDNNRLIDILRGLQHKGLVILRYSKQGLKLHLSFKGTKLVNLIWPEIHHINPA